MSELAALEVLIETGKIPEASAKLAEIPDDQSSAGVYAAYLRARILQFSGRLPEARNRYRNILSTHPELGRVRMALAQTLAQMQDYGGARHNYEMVLGTLGDLATDKTAAERIRNDLTALENAKRWTAQVTLAVVPTDNVNNGVAGTTVNIGGLNFTPTANGKKIPGVVALYGGEFAYLQPLADDIGLLGAISTSNYDPSGTAFDFRNLATSLGPQLRVWTGVVSAEAVASRSWYGGTGYNTNYGGRLSSRFLLSDQIRSTANVTVTHQDYDVATYLNGEKISSALTLDRFTLPGQFVRFGASTDREHDANPVWSYQEYGGLLGYYLETSLFGLTLYPEISYAQRRYVADFPFTTAPRHDSRAAASMTFTKRDLQVFGFAPRVTYSYVQNESNIGLFAYRKQSLFGSWVRDF